MTQSKTDYDTVNSSIDRGSLHIKSCQMVKGFEVSVKLLVPDVGVRIGTTVNFKIRQGVPINLLVPKILKVEL